MRRHRPALVNARLAPPRAPLLPLLLALACGCADGRVLLDVTARTEGGALSGVDHLTVTATSEAMRQASVQVPVPGGAVPPDVVFTLRFAAGTSGRVRVAIVASAGDGAELGQGEAEATLGASAATPLSVVIRPKGVRPPDGTPTWRQQSVGLAGASVNALAVDPQDPRKVYAATADTGVWLSSDGATTWRPASDGMPRRPILALAIDPSRRTAIYAATDGAGMYKSEDGGGSWAAINSGPAGMGADSFVSVAVDPAHPDYVFIGRAGPKVYRSSNGGGVWFDMSSGITSYGPPAKSFAFHPSSGVVYVATYGSGLYRARYDGMAWSPIGGAPLTGTGKYLNAVAFSPQGDVVYVGGEITPDRLLYSNDDGANWRAVGSAPPAVGSLALFATQAGQRIYVGQGGAGAPGATGVYTATDGKTFSPGAGIAERVTAVAVDPQSMGVAYAATATGVYRTRDGAAWSLSVEGLTGNPVTALALDPKRPSTVYVGLQNAGLLRSTDGAASWSPPAAAGNVPPSQGVNAIAVDEGSAGVLWVGTRSAVWRSDNGGATFSDNGLGKGATALAASLVASGTIWAGQSGGVSFRAGAGPWTPAATGLPPKDIGWLAAHPSDAKIVYAAVPGAGAFVTRDGGGTWAAFAEGLPSAQVNVIAADPAAPGRVLIGTDQGIFASTGGAATDSSTGFTGAVTALGFSRKDPRVVLAGTRAGGVYRSSDGGATWAPYSTGLKALAVTRLVLDPQDAQVAYAGTVDGGVYKLSP